MKRAPFVAGIVSAHIASITGSGTGSAPSRAHFLSPRGDRVSQTDAATPRKSATSRRQQQPDAPKADPELVKELARIGANVNQIARGVNIACGRDDPFNALLLFDVMAEIHEDLEKLHSADKTAAR